MRILSTPLDLLARMRSSIDLATLAVATAIWTLVAVGVFLQRLPLPHGRLLVIAYPLALLAFLVLARPAVIDREIRWAAAWSALVAAAFWAAPYVIANPELALAAPACLCAALVSARFPAATVIALALLSGVLGSIIAFTGYNATPAVDLLLAGIWIALAIRVTVRRPSHRQVVWPALVGCVMYIGITVVGIFATDSIFVGWLSFRAATWYMLAFVLLAYAGWSSATYGRIARGFVVVAALVSGYAVLRWFVGPADAELEIGTSVGGGINLINGELQTFGSFFTRHQLAFWTASMAPLCLACALAKHGRWRLIGGVGTALSLFAILASQGRGPLVGMVAGLILVLALYQLARSSPGLHLGASVVALVAVVAAAAFAYSLTADSPQRQERLEGILNPTEDSTYEIRVAKWADALADIEQHPFGQGLGSAGTVGERTGPYQTIASRNLDSAYLKIAYEQGFAVMILFIVVLLALLATIALRALLTGDPEIAWPGIGAAGALASMMVSFYSGIYIETPIALAGWMTVGVGMAGLTRVAAADAEPASGPVGPPRAAGPRPLASSA